MQVEGVKFIAIFDIPHIVKGMRNNNMEKHIKHPDGSIVKWSHFQTAYEVDSKSQKMVRALPRIKEGHVYEEKMKVYGLRKYTADRWHLL